MTDRLKQLTQQLRADKYKEEVDSQTERRRKLEAIRVGTLLPERREHLQQPLPPRRSQEELDKLNDAFTRRTGAVRKFLAAMQQLRSSVHRTHSETARVSRLECAKQSAKAAFERDPQKSAQLKQEAEAYKGEADVAAQMVAENTQYQEEALKTMREELSAIDQEIEALGGRLSVSPKPALAEEEEQEGVQDE